jgi:hypothetical protein
MAQYGLSIEAVRKVVLRDARSRPSTPIGMAIDIILAGKVVP